MTYKKEPQVHLLGNGTICRICNKKKNLIQEAPGKLYINFDYISEGT